jgi:hypothetical protein
MSMTTYELEPLIATSLKQALRFEKKRYLEIRGSEGGTAAGFRDHVEKIYGGTIDRWKFEALAEASTRSWRAPPKKKGPDLFSLGGFEVPEYVTRPKVRDVPIDDEDDEDEEQYEQVDHNSATVQDLIDDSVVKLRTAARTSAAADKRARQADEALRRCRGDRSILLKDLAD